MEISSASLLKEARGFQTKKKLGQHFLVDVDVLNRIVATLGATTGDTVLEIGPGIGFLTRLLSETGADITAVDLDRESIERLKQMDFKGVELKHCDFLAFDIGQMKRPLKIVGNVPYQITGLILGHILGEIDRPSPWLSSVDSIVLTVQKEVAQRMVASPGGRDYSRVSILVSYFCEASLELVVPPGAFYPKPEVTSAIVKLVPRKQPGAAARDVRLMKQIIQAGFRQRRKMLRNALSFLRLPQDEIDGIFKRLSFDPQVRAERLSLTQFAMLADAVNEHLKTHAQNSSTGTSQDQSHV